MKHLEAIKRAQRLRWRLAKQKSRAGENPRDIKVGSVRLKPGQRHDPSTPTRKYWAAMSPAQRSKEMLRRKQVAAGKLASARKARPHAGTRANFVPKGFWVGEVSKLLRDHPRPQREVFDLLLKKYPDKKNAISVALPTIKRNGFAKVVNGMMTLGAVNGAAAAQ